MKDGNAIPITPLASPMFHLYLNVGNVWPPDAFSLEGNPGNFPANVMTRSGSSRPE